MSNKLNTGHRPKPKEIGLFLVDILYNALIIIALVLIIRTFLVSPFKVVGSSMADTLENNEFILIDKLSYLVGDIQRGDPVVFLPPPLSGDPVKFEATIQTDEYGYGTLNFDDFEGKETSSYCQNKVSGAFWFCKTHVDEKDQLYFTTQTGSQETDPETVKRMMITKKDLEQGSFKFQGESETNYKFKIYDREHPEYFVKRVIGIPGDTIKIENVKEGKVYLKKAGEKEFKVLEESFLNAGQDTLVDESEKEKIFVVPEGHYFVMGDNREHSSDSRVWTEPITSEPYPFLPRENIEGKVFVVLWPLTKIDYIESADF